MDRVDNNPNLFESIHVGYDSSDDFVLSDHRLSVGRRVQDNAQSNMAQ